MRQMLLRNQAWSYQSIFLCLCSLQAHEQGSQVVFHRCSMLGMHVASQWVYHGPLGDSGCYLWWCVPELYSTDSSVTQGGSFWLRNSVLSWKWLKRLQILNRLKQYQNVGTSGRLSSLMEISVQQFFKANCWDHVSSTINVWLILLRNIAKPSSVIMMSGIG